jgi:hypothetical protein
MVKKHWTISEVNAAAAAYLDATTNAVRGTDQPHDDFKMDLLDRWLKAGPAMPAPDMWSNRLDDSLDGASKLHSYIRDNIIKPLQKFNSSLRNVELSQPSGTSEDQNLNMAYAIFMKKTLTMDYTFKDFEINKWKLYTPYSMLKLMPKLMLTDATSITGSNSVDLTRGRGSKKGNKAAKKEQGELKRQAFRDAERERQVNRYKERAADTQDCLKDMTNEITQVRNSLDLFKDRMAEKNTLKNQRMVEKNAIIDKKIQVKGITAMLKGETNPQKRNFLTAKLAELLQLNE